MKNSRKGFVAPLLLGIIAVLFIGGGSYYAYFRHLKSQCIQTLERRIQGDNMVINFTSKPDELAIEIFKAELERLPSAQSVIVVSSEEVLRQFLEKHKGQKDIVENVQNLKENPLPPKITVIMATGFSTDELVSTVYHLGEKYNLPINVDGPYGNDLKNMIKNMTEESFFGHIGENFSSIKACANQP